MRKCLRRRKPFDVEKILAQIGDDPVGQPGTESYGLDPEGLSTVQLPNFESNGDGRATLDAMI